MCILAHIVHSCLLEIQKRRGEEVMKIRSVFSGFLVFLVLSIACSSYAWQGRMAGMGDPSGLLPDESDFLTHPSMIADGKGINFYGGYRYTFTDVDNWDITLKTFDPATGALLTRSGFRASGDENRHDAHLGSAMPLGSGRLGIFFGYSGKRNDFSGHANQFDPSDSINTKFRLDSDFDSFELRLLYGFSMGALSLGSEIQLAYRDEENKTLQFNSDGWVTNFPLGGMAPAANLFYYMIPYDSEFWEILFKESLSGTLGPMKFALTGRGGFIFDGDNKYDTSSSSGEFGKFKGDVEGWRVGGDLWLKHPLANGFSLPLAARIDYQRKRKDGFGPGLMFANGVADYVHKESIFSLEVGGGVSKEFSGGTTLAAGIYYAFLDEKNSFWAFGTDGVDFGTFDYGKYPNRTEHQIILKLAGEKEVSPLVTLRTGLNFFYGWISEDFKLGYADSLPSSFTDKISLDGDRWGIGAFAGGTVKLQRFLLEPFLGGGYRRLDISGNGFETNAPSLEELDKFRNEWFVSVGLSIKY